MNWIWGNYWLVVVIQVICIVHAYKKGLTNWIYLLIFLPLVGCLVYFIVEIFPHISSGNFSFFTDSLFNSKESTAELEKRLRISDTFVNRCALANGYASKNKYAKAIEVYENALTGVYQDDLEVLLQLGRLNFLEKNYQQSIHYFERAKLQNNSKFIRPDDELWLGISYFENGNHSEAETIFRNHIQFHKTVDAMYYYAELLLKENRVDEAKNLLYKVIDQKDLIPSQNRKFYMMYIHKAKKALSSLK